VSGCKTPPQDAARRPRQHLGNALQREDAGDSNVCALAFHAGDCVLLGDTGAERRSDGRPRADGRRGGCRLRELFETFKGRLSSDPKWTESRMHELMDATFEEVRGLDLPGVSTSDEVIVRASTALAQLMADAVLQTMAVYLARHGSR
jgi:hypothetical protein